MGGNTRILWLNLYIACIFAPFLLQNMTILIVMPTFVAGIHLSLRICLLGLTMALAVPAIAWLKQSALFLLLATIALVAIALAVWWIRSGTRSARASL